ncbi:hypothetical protein EYF80_037225 [Liparis tanakae]|uniref:Uncharacterized protein n=1 Tax=Liparis tanakae TaxID=230148 RepID=A0A4Z2GHB2_9TELE|nr:hypothetical protein EYF80_037225 [Liparis tanakae]
MFADKDLRSMSVAGQLVSAFWAEKCDAVIMTVLIQTVSMVKRQGGNFISAVMSTSAPATASPTQPVPMVRRRGRSLAFDLGVEKRLGNCWTRCDFGPRRSEPYILCPNQRSGVRTHKGTPGPGPAVRSSVSFEPLLRRIRPLLWTGVGPEPAV